MNNKKPPQKQFSQPEAYNNTCVSTLFNCMKRMMNRLILTVVTAALFMLQGCDLLLESRVSFNDYPTTLRPLSPAQLQHLKKEYDELNGGRICTSLNEFGFPEYSLTPCLNRSILRVPISETPETATARTKLALAKNAKFTNIQDTSDVTLLRANRMNGCIKCDGSPGDIQQIRWRIDFANQWYQGLEVLESGIVAFADAEGVIMLGGNTYRDIEIPQTDRVSFADAKTLLVGRELHYSDWTGAKTFKITKDSFPAGSEPGKVILPTRFGENMELRVTWRVPVGSDSPWWFIYVDSTTGEVMREQMLIVF